MSETCPVCESELRLIAYGWVCPNAECPIDELSDNDLALARATAAARVAEAEKPWREAVTDLMEGRGYVRARALLDKAGE